MRLFYFPDMPIDAVQARSLVERPELYDTPDDPTKQVKLSRRTWERLYGSDILESLKEHGQLNPCHVSWYPEHEQWLVDPGEARWDAMKELEFDTFRVLLRVDDKPHPFIFQKCKELHTMEMVLLLYRSKNIVRNLNDERWFNRVGWALPDTEGERVAMG